MIYLDYQATTPLAPEALAAMRPLWEEGFGNPHSPHRMGRAARAAVEYARDRIAAPFGPGGRLLFTGGATEALNWAIKGIVETIGAEASPRRRIVTTAIEHAAVLDTVAWLGRQGHEVVILTVTRDGIVDLDAARAMIDGDTALVAAMLVNNEIGTIQPIAELGALARAAGAVMICDAVQGYGRVPLPVEACDLVAISAHKIHGPKGIGALWLRDGIVPAPLMHGGGQEGGLRSGTLAPALCAGFGAAAALAFDRIAADAAHVETLWHQARGLLDGWMLNGSADQRWHGNLNVRREGLDVSRLMADLRDIAFSAGSACASGSGRPSHVLEAIGLASAEARSSIRLGFGRYTTSGEIETAMTMICEAADRQRALP
ncbi:cysteine desulfurase family protein [Sphingomonas abietis]|uniref:Cysteine desulfurase n=1 Tax=Sphingomonas abietis TaxID=3012344 RepID=A0ABY7NNH5_9SPHN|nr:cysteine desulfurase family protein [Sphingomonas abietis]WBO21464.1 cysteine desulfurase family protein [Sphingomonas abietis]